jgi:hypothetical protein
MDCRFDMAVGGLVMGPRSLLVSFDGVAAAHVAQRTPSAAASFGSLPLNQPLQLVMVLGHAGVLRDRRASRSRGHSDGRPHRSQGSSKIDPVRVVSYGRAGREDNGGAGGSSEWRLT